MSNEKKMADRLGEALEGMFESVALTRRQHFEQNPKTRPSRGDVESIATSYANNNALVAGAANMVPGPWGALAIVPEITLIVRNQIQMIYDIGVAHGHEAHIDGTFLLNIFATVMGGAGIGLATVQGGQLLMKRPALRILQKIIVWLGGKITQRVLKQFIAKWLPVVGAAAMAVWARQSTLDLGRKAAELLRHEVIWGDGEVDEGAIG
jgi:uncharacterized protein (DUF697 family)